MEERDIIITVRASCKGDPRNFKHRIVAQLEALSNPDRGDEGLTLVGTVTISEERTTERVNFFYYSVAKRPEEMDADELVREIHAANCAVLCAREMGQGINTKEVARKRNCELALVGLPKGIDRWNEEFAQQQE